MYCSAVVTSVVVVAVHVHLYEFCTVYICSPANLQTIQFCKVSSRFEADNIKHASSLLRFLNCWSWQRRNRSKSTKFPQVSKLIKKEAILRDFRQEWKVECRADGLAPTCFVIVPFYACYALCLPWKKWSMEVWKLNFRQYERMDKLSLLRRSWDRVKVKSEKITQGESQKREDAGARKGRKVANNVFQCFSNVLWLRRVNK